jgi:hypothetical protein
VVAPMLSVIVSKDEMIEQKYLTIRDYMLALQNHNESMSKKQIVNLCRDIIHGLIDILEMVDE